MAWPPPVLPINRTNATPQLDTHAADHNAVNQAVNDVVARMAGQVIGTAAITPLNGDLQLLPTMAYASFGVSIDNPRAGSVALVIAECGIEIRIGGCAATVRCGYTPPSGGIVEFGGPGIVYIPDTVNILTIPVVGRAALTEVGTYSFFLRAGTSTTVGGAWVPSGTGTGISMILG